MKKTTTCLMLCAFASLANGAVYSITNSIGDGSIGITELDGKPGAAVATKGFNTTEGFGTFGYFDISDALIQSSTNYVDLMTHFVAFNNNASAFGATTLGSNGIITMGNSDLDVGGAGAAFDGKNIYMVFANVTNMAAFNGSTQLLVLKHATELFDAADDVPAVKSVTFDSANTTLLIGQLGTYSFKTRTSDTTTGPAWNTVAVPEPSAALLGAVGALGLLRRRRI